jgi:protein-S-isoprenylcysteine O-methyltransferase Ste14
MLGRLFINEVAGDLTMSMNRISKNRRRALDAFEQAVVLVLYIWLVWRLFPETLTLANWWPVLLLISEGLVVVLLLLRRQTDQISTDLRDWAVAFGGTFLVLLVGPSGESISVPAGAVLMVAGLAINVGAKLSLRRSFGLVAADRGVKQHGLYALVRHPMYAGYMLTHAGFLLLAPSLWNVAIYAVAWTLLVARIFAEERVLSANPLYRAYAASARYRLVPGLF